MSYRMRDHHLIGEDDPILEQINTIGLQLDNIIMRSFKTEGTGELLQLGEEINEKREEYAKFSSLMNIPRPAGIRGSDNFPGKRESWIVILPSSTDRLGLHIYAALLDNPRAKDIYCFSVHPEAHLQQLNSLGLGGFGTRVHFLETFNITAPKFGLRDETVLRRLVNAHPTHIVLPSWRESIDSFVKFEPLVSTIQSFLEFSLELLHDDPPEMVFLENTFYLPNLLHSISSSGSLVPEMRFTEANFAWCTDYEASIYVTEMLLESVTWITNADVSTKIVRFGDISEPQGLQPDVLIGAMNEWFASVIITSIKLKILPETLGGLNDIRWIPVDAIGKIVSDIMGDEGAVRNSDATMPAETKVYHVVSPHIIKWSSDVLPFAKEILSIPEVIPLQEWIKKVGAETGGFNPWLQQFFVQLDKFIENASTTTLASCRNKLRNGPVGKLKLDTRNAINGSKTFRKLQPIKPEYIRDLLKRLSALADSKLLDPVVCQATT